MELPPLNYEHPSPYPNTPLIGTSPYKLGRGPPAKLVPLSDELRPKTTLRTKPQPVDGFERVDRGLEAPPVLVAEPAISTRSDLQNHAFSQRYKF